MNIKPIKNKTQLLNALKESAEILKSNNILHVINYIEKELILPQLEGSNEYILKWDFNSIKINKGQPVWDQIEKRWIYINEENITEIPLLVSVNEASKLKDCTVSYVRRLCRNGILTSKKINNDWLISTQSLKKYRKEKKNDEVL